RPPVPPPLPTQRGGTSAQMEASSLMDDDEDVPTTVAVRDNDPSQANRPRPAAGVPAMAQQGPPSPFGAVNYAADEDRTRALPQQPDDGLGHATGLPNVSSAPQQFADAERARQQMPTSPDASHQLNPYAQQPYNNGYGSTIAMPQQAPIDAFGVTAVQGF